MDMKFIVLLIAFTIVEGRIKIDVDVNKDKEVVINYSGYEKNVITNKYVDAFGINDENLKKAVTNHYHERPKDVFLKSPTPWGDLYKKYNWEQVCTILQVKSAKVRNNSVKSVEVLSQDFDNPSNKTIKVTAGITQTVENCVSNAWSKTEEKTLSQEITYELNVNIAKASGTTGISVSRTLGTSGEKAETVTIGTTSGVEIELKPGQSARAVLTATRQTLEVYIKYAVTLRGNVAVNFKKKHNNHHFYGPSIDAVLKAGDLNTELIRTETIKAGVYVDASMKVYDKETGDIKINNFVVN